MMSDSEINLFKKAWISSAICCALAAGFFLLGEQKGIAILTGAMLSSTFIVSGAWVLHSYIDAENKVFIKAFFISMAVRFTLVLILFAILIGVTKIDKIFFTVSFIISYLCQSVTEIIFINKILQKSSS